MSKTIVSPSRTAAIGPPCAASGATCPAIKPCVAPENRPSVRKATESPKSGTDQRRRNAEHLAHSRPALRPFVANHDHVVIFDLAVLHGLKGIFLAIENPRRPFVNHALMTCDFDHAAFRRQITFENNQAAGRLERIAIGRTTSCPGVSLVICAASAIVLPVTVIVSP